MKKNYLLTFGLLLLLLFGAGLVAQDLIVDYEDFNIGDPQLAMGWPSSDPAKIAEAKVADDPLAPGNNVLQFEPRGYNAAPVVVFTLPEGKTLADYHKLVLNVHFAQGDVGYKPVEVTVTQDEPKATRPFAHAPTPPEETQSEGVKIGEEKWKRGASTKWYTMEIDITNTLDYSGTIYIAFGMSQARTGKDDGLTTRWFADNIELKSLSTSISSVVKSQSDVFTSEGVIKVNNCIGQQVAVYSVCGTRVTNSVATSDNIDINVPKGMYVVVVDGVSKKVLVK